MSFGFGVGDIITLSQLAWKLYEDVYKVARKAPQEVQSLNMELGALAKSLEFLDEELKRPESILQKAGPERHETIKRVVSETEKVLNDMSKTMAKYDVVNSTTPKSKIQRGFAMVAYSMKTADIDKFRARMTTQYGYIQLLLTSAGNSSLERLEKEQQAIKVRMEEQKVLLNDVYQQVATNQAQSVRNEAKIDMLLKQGLALPPTPHVPRVSAVEVHEHQDAVSLMFTESAESRGSWLSIGLAEWIQAGKWWLIQSQIALVESAERNESNISAQAFVDLLKSSWIMLDIITVHPQRTYSHSGTQQLLIQSLIGTINAELKKIRDTGRSLPWSDILKADFNLWDDKPRFSLIRRTSTRNLTPFQWGIGNAKIACQIAAGYKPSVGESAQCIVTTCYNEEQQQLHLFAEDFKGQARLYVEVSELEFLRLKCDGEMIRKYMRVNDDDIDDGDDDDDDDDDDEDADVDDDDVDGDDEEEVDDDDGEDGSDSSSEGSEDDDHDSDSEFDERGMTLELKNQQAAITLFTYLRGYDTSHRCFAQGKASFIDYLARSLLCEMVENRLYKNENQKMNMSNEVELAKRVRELDDVQMGMMDGKAQAYSALLHLARTVYDRALTDPSSAKAIQSKLASLHGLKIEDADEADRLCHIACGVAILVLSATEADGMTILKRHKFVLCRTDKATYFNKTFFLKSFRLAWDVRHRQLLQQIAQNRSWVKLDSQDLTVAEKENATTKSKTAARAPAKKCDSSFLMMLFRRLKRRDKEAIRFLLDAIPELQDSPDIGSVDLSRKLKDASREEVQLARWISSNASDGLLKRLKLVKVGNVKARKSNRD